MRPTPPHLARPLDRLSAASNGVKALDVALGRLLGTMEAEATPDEPERARIVALTAALVSSLRREGHTAARLATWAGRRFPGEPALPAQPLPSLPARDAWASALREAQVTGLPEANLPLVFDGEGVALARFWRAEDRIARSIAGRLSLATLGQTDAARSALATLFPDVAGAQARAASAALRSRVVLVAGGPGTGKTYTATRLLALLQADAAARGATPLHIALAAPTGKAAQRLAESLERGVAELPSDLLAPGSIPTSAETIHRLLGYHPRRGFRHDARAQLPHDLVLVDEASMIDAPLFDALLAALRPDARLVVLGDPDQLASVEAGSVFGDLMAASADDATPLARAAVTLTRSRRFEKGSDVGLAAVALRDQRTSRALELLRDPKHPDVSVNELPAPEAAAWALEHARRVLAEATPEAALDRLASAQLLAALRRGDRGVEGLCAAVEAELKRGGVSIGRDGFYPGRPLLITANDRETDLYNGDIGVCWLDGGRRVVCFPQSGGAARRIDHARLPEHQAAWAITVHKSQGAEYDRVAIVLPEPGDAGLALVTRELLYTAITRAKTSAVLFAEAGVFAEGIGRRERRETNLRARLTEALAEMAEPVAA